jgi:hypothetical protein
MDKSLDLENHSPLPDSTEISSSDGGRLSKLDDESISI